MVVRVEQSHEKHINFYEGNHIGFHPNWNPEAKKEEDRLFGIVIEGVKDSLTISLLYDGATRIFLMNEQGKTIESKYI